MYEEDKQQYSETVQNIKDLITNILNNNSITDEDSNLLESLRQQEQEQYSTLKDSVQQTLNENAQPMSKEDLINILTDFGKSSLFKINEDGSVSIGGQNIPELNACKITVDEQNRQIESLVSDGYVEVDGEKTKINVAYSRIHQDVNSISEDIVKIDSDLNDTTVLANNIKDTAEEHTQKISAITEHLNEQDGSLKEYSEKYNSLKDTVDGHSRDIVDINKAIDDNKTETTTKYNSLKDTVDEHSRNIVAIDEKIDNTNKDITNVNTKYNSLKDTVDEHSQTIGEVKEGVIKNITNQYYLSTSSLKCIGGSWSDDLPTTDAQKDKFLWFRTVTTYTNPDMSNSYGEPICTQGAQGIQGVAGADGISIVWKPDSSTAPSNPKNGWAYYNTKDKKSYVYQDNSWYTMSIDGVDGKNGEDGKSMYYKGKMTTPPSNPELNWCYKDSDNGIVYIYNGTSWEVMTRDGNDGKDGTDGINGWGVFITYNDSTSQPSKPTGQGTTNGWHTDVTSSVVWMSQKVAKDASSGSWSSVMKIKGDKGDRGADGTDGKNGADGRNGSDGKNGVGVSSVVPQYAWDSSSTYISPNDSTWSNSMPTYSNGRNLWIRQKVTYTDGTVVYTDPTCDPSWMAMKDCYTSYTQLDDKFSWIVKSGSSSSNFEITDRLASLVTNKVVVNAKSMELTGSININNGTFKVSTNGNTKIGGSSEYSIEGYSRARCEITSSGTLYNVGSSSSYTKIDDGKLHCTQSSRNLDFDSNGLQITYGSSSTDYLRVYEDGIASGDNELKLGNSSWTMYVGGSSVNPGSSNNGKITLGYSGARWSTVYSTSSTISTSDRTAKENIKYIKAADLYSSDIDNQLTYNDMYNFIKDDLYLATYNYIEDDNNVEYLNFISQDILLHDDNTDNEVGQMILGMTGNNLDKIAKGNLAYYEMNYQSVIAGALKKAINEIETLKEKITNLEGENNES